MIPILRVPLLLVMGCLFLANYSFLTNGLLKLNAAGSEVGKPKIAPSEVERFIELAFFSETCTDSSRTFYTQYGCRHPLWRRSKTAVYNVLFFEGIELYEDRRRFVHEMLEITLNRLLHAANLSVREVPRAFYPLSDVNDFGSTVKIFVGRRDLSLEYSRYSAEPTLYRRYFSTKSVRRCGGKIWIDGFDNITYTEIYIPFDHGATSVEFSEHITRCLEEEIFNTLGLTGDGFGRESIFDFYNERGMLKIHESDLRHLELLYSEMVDPGMTLEEFVKEIDIPKQDKERLIEKYGK